MISSDYCSISPVLDLNLLPVASVAALAIHFIEARMEALRIIIRPYLVYNKYEILIVYNDLM